MNPSREAMRSLIIWLAMAGASTAPIEAQHQIVELSTPLASVEIDAPHILDVAPLIGGGVAVLRGGQRRDSVLAMRLRGDGSGIAIDSAAGPGTGAVSLNPDPDYPGRLQAWNSARQVLWTSEPGFESTGGAPAEHLLWVMQDDRRGIGLAGFPLSIAADPIGNGQQAEDRLLVWTEKRGHIDTLTSIPSSQPLVIEGESQMPGGVKRIFTSGYPGMPLPLPDMISACGGWVALAAGGSDFRVQLLSLADGSTRALTDGPAGSVVPDSVVSSWLRELKERHPGADTALVRDRMPVRYPAVRDLRLTSTGLLVIRADSSAQEPQQGSVWKAYSLIDGNLKALLLLTDPNERLLEITEAHVWTSSSANGQTLVRTYLTPSALEKISEC